MASHPIGSYWRRWDLHVHTPASYVHKYGSGDEAWEAFLQDLESVPESFAVIGVNDYLFLDGYRQLLGHRRSGRIANIETLFPVVELRLARFGGTDRLRRINYHVIFSDELEPDIIETQFLAQLRGKAKLSAELDHAPLDWKGFANRASVTDLGAKIRASATSEHQAKYWESDFVLGMNNLCFDQENVLEILRAGPATDGKYVTAVGKAEWDQFRWTDHSIAEKKNLINGVDTVFTAATDAAAYQRARAALNEQGVNARLLDCSDAHAFAAADDKDRVGNCLQWIKADPTFAGLKIAIEDFDSRTYVGSEPPSLQEVARRPRAYVKGVTFGRRDDARSSDRWFAGQSVVLHPELVTIVGNRGSGKSALLDSIAFCGRSRHPVEQTSFLGRFRHPKDGRAEDYDIRLEWYGGEPSEICLGAPQDSAATPMVKHLPQRFIDQLCNESSDIFSAELETAIFSHVPDDERLGAQCLKELVEKLSHQIEVEQEAQSRALFQLNSRIADLEQRRHPAAVDDLRNRLSAARDELHALLSPRARYPVRPSAPGSGAAQDLGQLKEQLDDLSRCVARKREKRKEVRASAESAKRIRSKVTQASARIAEVASDAEADLQRLGLAFTDLVKVVTDLGPVEEIEARLESERAALDADLDPDQPDTPAQKHKALAQRISEITEGLGEAERRHQASLQAHRELRERVRSLVGTAGEPDTVRGIESELGYVGCRLDADLADLYEQRFDLAAKIVEQKQKLLRIYRDLYEPVQTFVRVHGGEESLDVQFEASLVESGFEERFLELLARNRKGTFYGAEEAGERLSAMVGRADFDMPDSIDTFLREILGALHEDKREGYQGQARHVQDQVRGDDTLELCNFLFGMSYLVPEYRITLNGKPLDALSPGEKGALLLVFYLLVDQSRVPLLIDQPEENLDNQSVYTVLRPFISEARRRRQVILVTHNPNIAVLAGADQVICCSIDKPAGCQVNYESGSIENPRISERIVDVLEGTMPAFTRRDSTYRVTDHKWQSR